MNNIISVIAKTNANYTCQECGATELIQSHHQVKGDDNSLIALCANCHSKKHPHVPHGLFFNKQNQKYWYNISASSIARSAGCHSRTIIRKAKRLGLLDKRVLLPTDIELIKSKVRRSLLMQAKLRNSKYIDVHVRVSVEDYQKWVAYKEVKYGNFQAMSYIIREFVNNGINSYNKK